jgi:nicotinic acid phosphoribosyltransferase
MEVPPPINTLVTAMLTDLYQITMAYAHWKNQRHEDQAVFELFFRKSFSRLRNKERGCALGNCMLLIFSFCIT